MDSQQKDCACLTHEGPHWLHMDQLWHARNKALLEQARRYEESALPEAKRYEQAVWRGDNREADEAARAANWWLWLRDNQLRCHAQAELARLAEKERHLTRVRE